MKIRTDFVTNSSSSSFVLVIRIGLKNGEVLRFIGDSGVGEGDEAYYQLAALKSPEELGRSGSIEALIQALKESIVEEDVYDKDADDEVDKPVLDEGYDIIKGLRKLQSIEEVDTITINGDLYGGGDQYNYGHYTYYMDKNVTVYDEGGDDVVDEGTGGRIGFYLLGKNVCEADVSTREDAGKGYDGDVPLPQKGMEVFVITDGVLKEYKGGDSTIIIPDSVTAIGEAVFRGCMYLKKITIPESVESIGKGAFLNCRGLTGVMLPEKLTHIGELAFGNCSSLEIITIPENVVEIEDGAFEGCNCLSRIDVNSDNTEFASIDGTLFSKDGKKLIRCPEGFSGTFSVPDGVAIIGDSAFDGCTDLDEVEIPEGVIDIGKGAFNGCFGLTSVTLPDGLKHIGDYAFRDCESLTEITIPEGVFSIGMEAFNSCSSLTDIVIPKSVHTIGEGAFTCCDAVETINIPQGVVEIKDRCFQYCSELRRIVIPQGVLSIGREAFDGCSELETVTIPNSVTSIGEGAFESCDNLTKARVPSAFKSDPAFIPSVFKYCSHELEVDFY